MISKVEAVESLRPGVGFVMRGGDVEAIEWMTDGVEPLTEADVATEITRLEQAAADKAAEDAAARDAAIAHAKSLGFTDEMIAVMYPNLNAPAV